MSRLAQIVLSGHGLVRCTCLLLTQSGHRPGSPPSSRYVEPLRLLLGGCSMKRREFITLVSAASVAWPLKVRAQQPERMRHVGLLLGYSEGDAEGHASAAAFRQRLQELGWTEGRNIRINTRWAGADPNKARAFAKHESKLMPFRACSARPGAKILSAFRG